MSVRFAASTAMVVLAALALAPRPAAAEENDLREFRIGMPVSELPKEGYLGFACADDPKHKLNSWQEYEQCPADASGLRAVRFRYDEDASTPITRSVNGVPLSTVNGLYEGTKVGGHPVLLSLLLGHDRVEGLVIETDPSARLYLRKKAFLFADQARARYGEDGWACTSQPQAADEEPVGGVYINEHCEKTTPTRRLVLDHALFRRAGQELKDFVSRARLEILARPGA